MSRPTAVFTIVQNEPVFLNLWLRYYTRHFDARDVYVLDHGTSDGSVALAQRHFGVQIVPVYRGFSFDHRWLRDTVQAFQRFLLQNHERVLFAEADEFVVADPTRYPRGLREFVDTDPRDVVRCRGFDLVQPAYGVPIDLRAPLHIDTLTVPILSQNRRMAPNTLYSKTLLSRVPLEWDLGFHQLADPLDYSQDPDPYLLLLHLHRFDYDLCLARHRERVTRRWAAEDLVAGRGAQSRIVDPDAFRRWFYAERLDDTCGVPDNLREVF